MAASPPVTARPALMLKDIRKMYRMGENEVHALRGVSLEIEEGDFVAIMGPSGSGKSTLMHVLGLLDTPTSGSYRIGGRETARLTEDELAVLRREEIGFIFQQFNLLPRLSAVENVALPVFYSRKEGGDARAVRLMGQVGLGSRMHHRPNEMSGGQQQRVAIARSLINHPRMVLADEPTGNLDSASEREIMAILRDLNAQGITVIIVTHEEEIGRQARRVIRMRDGAVSSDERLGPVRASEEAVERPALATPPQSRLAEVIEHFRSGFKTLAANKVRTALSMLGILIGVAAVVAMLALGRGAQKAIESQLSSLGSNLLVLWPGAIQSGGVRQQSGTVTRITLEDAQAIRAQVAQVVDTSPNVNGRGQLTWLNKNWNTLVLGTSPSYASVRSAAPEIGRFFTEEEAQQRARVALVGMTVVRELFGGQNPVGEMFKINKVSFQVIGVLPPKGATGWRDQDDTVIIPAQTAMYRLFGKPYIDSIDIQVADPQAMDDALDQVVELMATRHRVQPAQKEDAFQVRNMADIQAALSSSSKTMSALLASIAAISLLVGGIGIMNIMLVSVTERTREIGLRKAIGARRRDILSQFLAESVVVSAVGGLAGIALGWAITELLSRLSGWTTSITASSVVLSFVFSAGIGIVFGIYPARKASLLNPIDALRHD